MNSILGVKLQLKGKDSADNDQILEANVPMKDEGFQMITYFTGVGTGLVDINENVGVRFG